MSEDGRVVRDINLERSSFITNGLIAVIMLFVGTTGYLIDGYLTSITKSLSAISADLSSIKVTNAQTLGDIQNMKTNAVHRIANNEAIHRDIIQRVTVNEKEIYLLKSRGE